MEVKSQFQFCPNFSNLTIYQAKVSNYSTTISSAICLSLLVLLLGLLVLYKAYKTTLQRLFLQYTTAVAITNVVRVLNVELQFDVNKNFCNWLALLEQWWVMTVQLLALSLVIYLSYETCQKLRSRPLFPCYKNVSKRSAILIEVLYTSLAVLLPLVYVWMPMKHHKYGLAQSLCWSVTYDINCNIVERGKLYFNTHEIIIFTLDIIVTLSVLVMIVMFHLKIFKNQQNRESKYNNTKFRALVFLAVLCISVMAKLSQDIVNLGYIGIINIPIDAFYFELINELVQTIVSTMQPLGFAVYLYSPNKLRPRYLKNAAREWLKCKWTCAHCCCCKSHPWARVESRTPLVNRISNEGTTTFEGSISCYIPSYTTFSTPYTNEFTNITEIISSSKCQTVPNYGGTMHY